MRPNSRNAGTASLGQLDGPWRVDETYVKIKGRWTYLYRAVDKEEERVDFLLHAPSGTSPRPKPSSGLLSGVRADHRLNHARRLSGLTSRIHTWQAGRCVTNTFLKEEVGCCTRDEGGPLEASGQARPQTPAKLRSSRAMVVSSCSKRWDKIPSGVIRRGERKRTADEVSKCQRRCQNRGVIQLPGSVRELSR